MYTHYYYTLAVPVRFLFIIAPRISSICKKKKYSYLSISCDHSSQTVSGKK